MQLNFKKILCIEQNMQEDEKNIKRNSGTLEDLNRSIGNKLEHLGSEILSVQQSIRSMEDGVVLARIHDYEHATKGELNDLSIKLQMAFAKEDRVKTMDAYYQDHIDTIKVAHHKLKVEVTEVNSK
jgi:hypothetical protein